MASLAEIAVDARTGLVLGATIREAPALSAWPSFAISAVREGSPLLPRPPAAKFVDLESSFQLARRDGETLLFWSRLDVCEESRAGGRRFFIRRGLLCAIAFPD